MIFFSRQIPQSVCLPCLNYLSRDAIRELYQEIHNFPALLVYHDSYLNDSYLPLVPDTWFPRGTFLLINCQRWDYIKTQANFNLKCATLQLLFFRIGIFLIKFVSKFLQGLIYFFMDLLFLYFHLDFRLYMWYSLNP